MLAKQAWRILTNSSSLVVRVLKARYFPTGNLLNAKLGSSLSYSWRSIHSNLEIIRCGTRWIVGNGKQIHIWEDRWLPTPSTYKAISPQNHNTEFPMVSSLVDLDTKWWKTDVLRSTFLPFEVEIILKIPLSHNLPEDKLIWVGNKKGEFAVKSAYHIAHNLIESNEEGESSFGDPCRMLWRNLWHLNLPAKLAICTLEDFRKATSLDLLPPRQSATRWMTPPQGVFKINVDGATSDQGRNSSIGVIIRDCNGQVVVAFSKYSHGRFVADQVEALVMEQGILLAQELQLSCVILESDALAVIQAINDNTTGSDLGHILQGV
ncbi:uncharacterized protein LOC111990905 [Quercus suber]|uniref:uncharacterized protein LOC111990905 n=1 Tax=Quercus suber TaxID=58331 RepID=UPI000CE1844F|nr:uncharacterized protein LOC111990905 [Quercus suber]